MNAKNNNEVYKAIVRFSIYLFVSIVITVGSFSLFMKTSLVEVNRIISKTSNYDMIQMKQVHLTESVDSLYYYSTLLNADDIYINRSVMYNVLSTKSLQFRNELDNLTAEDCLLYKHLSGKTGDFILLKDSIHLANLEVERLREEYIRCMNRNKELTRRLFTGNVY